MEWINVLIHDNGSTCVVGWCSVIITIDGRVFAVFRSTTAHLFLIYPSSTISSLPQTKDSLEHVRQPYGNGCAVGFFYHLAIEEYLSFHFSRALFSQQYDLWLKYYRSNYNKDRRPSTCFLSAFQPHNCRSQCQFHNNCLKKSWVLFIDWRWEKYNWRCGGRGFVSDEYVSVIFFCRNALKCDKRNPMHDTFAFYLFKISFEQENYLHAYFVSGWSQTKDRFDILCSGRYSTKWICTISLSLWYLLQWFYF